MFGRGRKWTILKDPRLPQQVFPICKDQFQLVGNTVMTMKFFFSRKGSLGKVKWILRAKKTEKNFSEQTKSNFMQ